VGEPEGKRPLGRPRRMCVNNIEMGLRDIGWDGMDWIDLAPDRNQWKALSLKKLTESVFDFKIINVINCCRTTQIK
jgi:hypothetical protein